LLCFGIFYENGSKHENYDFEWIHRVVMMDWI